MGKKQQYSKKPHDHLPIRTSYPSDLIERFKQTLSSFQVRAQDFGETIGWPVIASDELALAFLLGHVKAKLSLHQFRHQSVDRAATRRDLLQNERAVPLLFQSFLDSFNLSANAMNTGN